MSKFKEALGTKKLVAIVAVISSIVAVSTFIVLDNSRKEEEKARALEQYQAMEIEMTYKSRVCGEFGNSLNLLTSTKFSSKNMKENNSRLNLHLKAWSTKGGESNGLHTKLSKYRGVIEKSLAGSNPKESKEFLDFQKSNFNYLILTCNLDKSYTYPSTLTFLSGCWIQERDDNGREIDIRVELQVKTSSNSWAKVSSKDGDSTDYCVSEDGADGTSIGSSTGADFSIELGLERNNLKSYGTYRVRFTKEGNQKFFYGQREIYSCELRAKKPDDTLYPVLETNQLRDGCDGKGNPDYKPEPDIDDSSDSDDYIDSFPNPWEREFNDEWSEGTAKFTWCWNRGLQYSSEADACY